MSVSQTWSREPSQTPASSREALRRGWVSRALLGMVKGYQWLRAGRVSPCRFYPSCSAYAVEAIEVHGAARGSWLALRRLGRCRPGGRHGIDLVPLKGER